MFSQPLFTRGCAPVAKRSSRTNCCLRCATNSAAMLSPNMAVDKNPRPAGPCVVVIFGASGDLTKRLLIPAIYHLKRAGLLPEQFAILGVARSDDSSDSLRRNLRAAVDEFAGQT